MREELAYASPALAQFIDDKHIPVMPLSAQVSTFKSNV